MVVFKINSFFSTDVSSCHLQSGEKKGNLLCNGPQFRNTRQKFSKGKKVTFGNNTYFPVCVHSSPENVASIQTCVTVNKSLDLLRDEPTSKKRRKQAKGKDLTKKQKSIFHKNIEEYKQLVQTGKQEVKWKTSTSFDMPQCAKQSCSNLHTTQLKKEQKLSLTKLLESISST